MVDVRIRDTESCDPQPNLLWDTVWVQRVDASGGYGDWMLAGDADQPESRGGLRAEAAIHTATLLCLFTDRRAEEGDILPSGDGDRRGWWADSIRLADEPDVPLGSRLWLLERAVLNEAARQAAEDYAAEGLAVLAEQGAVAETKVAAAIDWNLRAILLTVEHFDQTGTRMYAQRFGVLWDQTRRNAPMNFGDQTLLVA